MLKACDAPRAALSVSPAALAPRTASSALLTVFAAFFVVSNALDIFVPTLTVVLLPALAPSFAIALPVNRNPETPIDANCANVPILLTICNACPELSFGSPPNRVTMVSQSSAGTSPATSSGSRNSIKRTKALSTACISLAFKPSLTDKTSPPNVLMVVLAQERALHS